jgi:flagellar motor switch protein FliN
MTDDLSSERPERRPATPNPDASAFRSIDEMSDADNEGGCAAVGAAPNDPHRLALLMNIPVRLSVELGRAKIPIREVVNVGRGSVIELDRSLGEPLDVRVNGVLIGHGEIVVFDEERLGLRFVDVVSQAERVDRLT